MIITHLAAQVATPTGQDNSACACDGLLAQPVTREVYEYVKDDLNKSHLVHHIIVIDDEMVNCADCADILAEQKLAIYEAERIKEKVEE